MIKVNSANYISELGKRSNNEDNCAINPNKTFIVCDGVGGSEKGEIASDLVVREFIHQFNENAVITANEAIKHVEGKLSEYIKQHPESMGMATTLTLAHIQDNAIYVAWCGDSRVYQFRGGRIVYKTLDHSWVLEALKAGIITEEEAINHPRSNVITRAIQGAHKPVSIEDTYLTDLKVNDTFLLCSDGVLESWNDEDLSALFSSEKDVDILLHRIKEECAIHSRDNFTAVVFKLNEVSVEANKVIEDTQPIIVYPETNTVKNMLREPSTDEHNELRQNHHSNNPKPKKLFKYILYFIIMLSILGTLFCYIFINYHIVNIYLI
jgi:protein phosphatase